MHSAAAHLRCSNHLALAAACSRLTGTTPVDRLSASSVCHSAAVYLAVLRLLPHLLRLSTSLAGRLPAAVAGTSCGVLVALQRRMRCPQQQQGELT